MNGGRFLIGLRKMELSERVLLTTSLLKELVYIFDEDLRKENIDESLLILVHNELNALSSDLNLACLMKREYKSLLSSLVIHPK